VTDLFGGGAKYGAFQHFSVAKETKVAKIPEQMDFIDASVLPVCFSTALVALCGKEGQGFGLRGSSLTPEPWGQIVMVWGASSWVELATLQVARAAGITTIATASPRNFEFVKSAGASLVLDYNSSSVLEGLVHAIRSTKGHFVGVLDCISDEKTSLPYCVSLLERIGGGKLGITRPDRELDLPDTVELSRIFDFNELIESFWKDFLTPALERGMLECLPPPRVVGEGLECLQEALEILDRGVSATKLVVTL
jgi:NADPH:quinone reductase-like Zn-dependent oxidoreductase